MIPHRLYVANLVCAHLPLTRFYPLKRQIYRLCDARLGRNVRIVSGAKLVGNGKLVVGDNTFIGCDTLIMAAAASVTIGSHVDIAPRVMILNGTHRVDMEGPHAAGDGYSLPIVIGDGVWIGAGTTVLAGAHIGQHSVIAAGSVVTKAIPPFCVAAGAPCAPVKQWESGAFVRVTPGNGST